MRRLEENEEVSNENKVITVKTLLSLNIFRFLFSEENTIFCLKNAISKTDEFGDVSYYR